MIQLPIQKNFLAHRSVTAFSLCRVCKCNHSNSDAFFGQYGCVRLVSLHCSEERTKARNKQIVEQDLCFTLAARARQNKMQHKSYHSVVLWMSNLINEFYLQDELF